MSVETGRREGVFDSSSSGLVGYRSLFGVSEAASNGRFMVGRVVGMGPWIGAGRRGLTYLFLWRSGGRFFIHALSSSSPSSSLLTSFDSVQLSGIGARIGTGRKGNGCINWIS